MDLQEITATPTWQLYEKSLNYHRMIGTFTDTDKNYRFYNGDQWAGAKLEGVEKTQLNFIQPIVKYKLSVIHSNLFAIVYSSLNFSQEFRRHAERYCALLNNYAARIWENDGMDKKLRRVTKDAAINDEGIIYVDFDRESMLPVNEVIKKNDIYYGNENDDNIQNQPYILLRKRMTVLEAVEFARNLGVTEENLQFIAGDNNNFEESGDAAKQELDNMVTVLYKLYRKDGTVHYSVSTRILDLVEDEDLGIKLYPIAHFNWEEKEGSARGEGEVRHKIGNQIEVNKIMMRRALTSKSQGHPTRVADRNKIANPAALNTVGGTIYTTGNTVDDVRKVVGIIPPAQMSPDVVKLQEDLVQVTRELAGAGDIATGQINPSSASGRAILAVRQASQAPMTEQTTGVKQFIEDLAKIYLEYIIAYAEDGLETEEKITDRMTGQETVQIVKVPQSALQQLKATVRIDITPKSEFDRFAQEQTLENLLTGGYFNAQRLGELKVYANSLDDDAVAPKIKLLEAIEYAEQQQRRIAEIQAQAQMMRQRTQQFLDAGPDMQAGMMARAMRQPVAQPMQGGVA